VISRDIDGGRIPSCEWPSVASPVMEHSTATDEMFPSSGAYVNLSVVRVINAEAAALGLGLGLMR
jgi:hypothetical protein